MEFAFLLIFSVVFLIVQASHSSMGKAWLSAIGIFVAVMLFLGILAGIAIESDSVMGIFLVDIVFLALVFYGIHKLGSDNTIKYQRKTPVQSAAQMSAAQEKPEQVGTRLSTQDKKE